MEFYEILTSVTAGILNCLTPEKLLWVVLASTLGTLIGAIPGLGPNVGVAVLLPLTFAMDSSLGLLVLIGIYLGCMYGGRISSILINTPGDAAAVVTCFDGYPMMQQGRGGVALGISAISSFIGGMIGIIIMTFLSPVLANWALAFGPPENFLVMLFSLLAICSISDTSSAKGLLMIAAGLLFAMVGSDYVSGHLRLTFGITEMMDGIDFVPVAVGIFGLSEVFVQIGKKEKLGEGLVRKLDSMFPSRKDLKEAAKPTLIGTVVGLVVGILPGAGATISTFAAYGAAKKLSKHPELYGKGSLEGVAAPEAANNATVPGALTPMMALGIPGSSVAALIMGGFIVHNLQPGPLMFQKTPEVAWTIIGGLYIVNVVLMVVNTAMIPVFVYCIRASEKYLYPLVAVLCVLGSYTLGYSMFDVLVMVVSGVLGYFMKIGDYPISPFLLALILGPTIENTFRLSLIMSEGSYSVFFGSTISVVLAVMTIALFVFPFIQLVRQKLQRSDQQCA